MAKQQGSTWMFWRHTLQRHGLQSEGSRNWIWLGNWRQFNSMTVCRYLGMYIAKGARVKNRAPLGWQVQQIQVAEGQGEDMCQLQSCLLFGFGFCVYQSFIFVSFDWLRNKERNAWTKTASFRCPKSRRHLHQGTFDSSWCGHWAPVTLGGSPSSTEPFDQQWKNQRFRT